MNQHKSAIDVYFSDSLGKLQFVLNELENKCLKELRAAIEIMVNSVRNQGRILVCGNGGSAADSQHFAGELVATFSRGTHRAAISAIALPNDIAAITAYANDVSYLEVFSRQVEAHGREGDTLLCISTSGTSVNVLNAAKQARAQGLSVVSMSGNSSTALSELSDVAIIIPSTETPTVQNTYQFLTHVLCFGIEYAVSVVNQEGKVKTSFVNPRSASDTNR